MLGLINRSIETFLTDTHGAALCARVRRRADLPGESYEPLLQYDDAQTLRLIDAACDELGRARSEFLEDLGAHLCSREAVRRLLRYGGCDYRGFLNSLNELNDRARMALPDLKLPNLHLVATQPGQFRLRVAADLPGWGAVLAGILRAMADDYGSLALIEVPPRFAGGDLRDPDPMGETVTIQLLDATHAEARQFALARMIGEV
ncbi:hypothetical protein BMI86_15175 [Thioclava sp. DLFJ5-1]|uniref:heme NO-binding domain-containing protein n=1 Tax=unclassified Thioclava TaxID=2621713 RepID=UPI000997685C|nr:MULTISPECIES: heme NO-binding domain-containing protein [unclassified Thioclava]OOY03913.1 hypothetical protein BMI87_16035 [Thioclava sp. F28-4]OOY19169.1 hypothetical protein BMI86_15175 [Thioclava sp. DLFJ5-1]